MEKLDWRTGVPMAQPDAFRAEMLLPGVGVEFYEPGDLTEKDLDQIAKERAQTFQRAANADDAWVMPINPMIGADWPGLGVVMDFLDVGADVIAWSGAAIYLAKALQRAKKKAEEAFAGEIYDRITWSGDALKVLAMADLRIREGMKAEDIRAVEHFEMWNQLIENRVELDQMYSLHVIGIKVQHDVGQGVWSYLVYADGSVLKRVPAVLPGAKGPSWGEVTEGLERLRSLENSE